MRKLICSWEGHDTAGAGTARYGMSGEDRNYCVPELLGMRSEGGEREGGGRDATTEVRFGTGQ